MKLFFAYLKQRRRIIRAFVLFMAVFAVSFALYELPMMAVAYPAGLCCALALAAAITDFIRVKRRHEQLCVLNELTAAEEKLLPPSESIDDEDYRRIIELLAESRAELAANAQRSMSDTLDYFTVWVHQIKTPIASMRLTLQNEDSPAARRLSSDLGRIEHYVDMAMVFLRLGSESTDYVIREFELDPLIRSCVRKFAPDFIGKQLHLELEPTHTSVVSDEKWLAFVIEQLLSNALKYTKTGSVRIYMTQPKTLCIRDTGIGIAPEDLPRIFEKGYTGLNGRSERCASGLGLYLCRSICRRLGHGLSAVSVPGEGTELRIDLYTHSLTVE